MATIRLGDTAPDFTQESTEGEISFHDFLGDGWGILFSHPADFTPVCTTELGTVARLRPEFDKRNTKAVGLSVDPIGSHNDWVGDIAETQGTAINFPLLADHDRKVAELYDMVERLAIRADVPMPKVAIMESAAPNAFATGRNPKNALVAVTTGIQERLTRRELEAVIGHELSHVKNRDVTVITLASFFLTVASFVMQMMFFRMMFGGFGGGRNNNGGAIMMLMVGTLVVQFVAQLLIMALSRYREYGADHSGAELTGDPGALANALEKISAASSRVPAEDLRKMTAASALAFYPALKGHSMQSLFSTHPPLEDRIARLRQMENEMRGLPQDIRFEN